MKSKPDFFRIIVPSATVFISNFCIMVLELVASRVISRHLGSSLYTWTAVIGVVLTGITIGNYVGGRIADRFKARKALTIIFMLCSVSCVITILLNNLIGEWLFLWRFSWPTRVFSHVTLVFLLPSLLLGTITPVVAKMALDQGLPKGRTVGDIYAWGAAGSIAGTFAAGYFLIATMGTVLIIWTIGIALLIMAIIYWAKFWPTYLWACLFAVLMTMGAAPNDWAQAKGASLRLRAEPDPSVLYEDESQYCYISVKRFSQYPEIRGFFQDKLQHSTINMDDPSNLQYFYIQVYAALTEGISAGKDKLSVMAIGGGGYVYPRYIEQRWPGSQIDVVEIDPAVTQAAIEGFGLQKDTTINTFNLDARNYVDDLLNKKTGGKSTTLYDYIYGDAFNDYSVPYQLVTKEFNDKIAELLTDDGVYLINVVDVFDPGLFAGAVFNTLKQTFPYVSVMAQRMPSEARNTFVLAASRHPINIAKAISRNSIERLKLWILTEAQITQLTEKSNHLVLTDNYSPTENLLAPVVRISAKEILSNEYMKRANRFKNEKKYDKSIASYRMAAKSYPFNSIRAYNEIAVMQGEMGQLEQAVESFKKIIDYNNEQEFKNNIGVIHYSLGNALQSLGQPEQAKEQFLYAIEGLKKELAEDPNSHKIWGILGEVHVSNGNLKAASEAFAKAFALNPTEPTYFYSLVKSLEYQGKYVEAIQLLDKQIEIMKRANAFEPAKQLSEYKEFLRYKRSKDQTKEN